MLTLKIRGAKIQKLYDLQNNKSKILCKNLIFKPHFLSPEFIKPTALIYTFFGIGA